MATGQLLIYGAGGFVAGLVARRLAGFGIHPILAAKDDAAIASLHGEKRIFGVRDARKGIEGCFAVLNCAGPFKDTARPLAEACIAAGVHYMDLSGEYPEHDSLVRLDAQARQAGVMLLPGVGFSVVATDCAAKMAAERLEGASEIKIGFEAIGPLSTGTAESLANNLERQGIMLADGDWKPVKPLETYWHAEFGNHQKKLYSYPWRADLVSVAKSTGIKNVQVFADYTGALKILVQIKSPAMRKMVLGMASKAKPSDSDLAKGKTYLWIEAYDGGVERSRVYIEGPDAYRFTTVAAAEIAKRVMSGQVVAGYQTPSSAFGSQLLNSLDGVRVVHSRVGRKA